MNYPIFLSDLDGTLLRSDGTISDFTKKIIARYRAAGGIFAVCTGRGLPSALPRARELGIEHGLVIASQGAVIADIATGELLRCISFPLQDALEVIRFFEKRDQHIHVYTINDFFANRRDDMLGSYEKIYGRKATIVSERLSQKTERESLAVVKALVMVEPEKREALFREAQEAFGEKYFVTCSSEWLIEVLPKGQSKAKAVQFISRYYGIPTEKIGAIGDQLNDLPMLEAAGGSFAVGNAVKELKENAVVVPSNDEDGVAYAIEKYAMGENYE